MRLPLVGQILVFGIMAISQACADCDNSQRAIDLQSDIDIQQQSIDQNEDNANNMNNNCSGPGTAVCQSIGNFGATLMRQHADEARQKLQEDQRELQKYQAKGCPDE